MRPSFRQSNTPSPLFLAALEEQRRQEALRAAVPLPRAPHRPLPPSPRGYVYDAARNRHFRVQVGGGSGGGGGVAEGEGVGESGEQSLNDTQLIGSISEIKKEPFGLTKSLLGRECRGGASLLSLPPIRALESRVSRILYRGNAGSRISSLAISRFSLPFSNTVSSPLAALSTDANPVYIGALDKGVTKWLPPFCLGRGDSAIKALTFASRPVNLLDEPGWPQSVASVLAVGSLGNGDEPGAVYIFAAHHSVEKLAKVDVTRGSGGGRSTTGGSLWSCCWINDNREDGERGGGGEFGSNSSPSSSPGSLTDLRLAIGASAGEDSAVLRLRHDGSCIAESKCVLTSDAFCCASDQAHGQVIFGTRSGSVVSWDLRTPSREARRVTQLLSSALSLNPLLDDEGLWLVGDAGIHLEVRDPRAWDRGAVNSIPGYDNTIVKHALGVSTCSPSNGEKHSTIAVCGRGNLLRLWDSRARLLKEVRAHDALTDTLWWRPSAAAFSPPQTDAPNRGKSWGRHRCIVASQTELIEIRQQRGM